MVKNEYVTIIENAVLTGNVSGIREILKNRSISPAGIKKILGALSGSIESARLKLRDGDISIPEFLLSIDAFNTGMSFAKGKSVVNKSIP
ncbi:MAG TPA: hypothetical protein PK253_07445, partial [Spirochaetota bacterium]|nr:hypothetical protein [Spirochaetota bacterium]